MNLKKGDIVLVPFPFTDLSAAKLRPSVILRTVPEGEDVIVCFITSQPLTPKGSVGFSVDPSDEEFIATGLKVSSKVLVSKVVTLSKSLLRRRLGQLEGQYLDQLQDALRVTFSLNPI